MPKFADRVMQATATTGTGTITLGSAMSGGYRRIADVLSEIPDGSVVRYSLVEGNSCEIGLGTTGSSGTTVTRSITGPGGWSTTGSLLNLAGNAVFSVTLASIDVRNGCLLTLSADVTGDLTLSSGVPTSWDTEVYDDAGWHSGGDATKLIVPAGVTMVRLGFNFSFTGLDDGATVFCNTLRNGLTSWSGRANSVAVKLSTSANIGRASGVSAPISAAEGDYFQTALRAQTDTSTTIASTGSNFWIEAL